MYRLNVVWAGHVVSGASNDLNSLEGVEEEVAHIQEELNAGVYQVASAGSIFTPTLLCIDILDKDRRIVRSFNLTKK